MESHTDETAPMTPGRIALVVALLCLALTFGLLG
jgi:hypothetical protein